MAGCLAVIRGTLKTGRPCKKMPRYGCFIVVFDTHAAEVNVEGNTNCGLHSNSRIAVQPMHVTCLPSWFVNIASHEFIVVGTMFRGFGPTDLRQNSVGTHCVIRPKYST